MIVSCFKRALQTSAPIIKALNESAAAHNEKAIPTDLHEIDGIFSGGRKDRVESEHPLVHGLNFDQMSTLHFSNNFKLCNLEICPRHYAIFVVFSHGKNFPCDYATKLWFEIVGKIVPQLALKKLPQEGWWRGGMETAQDVQRRAESVSKLMWNHVEGAEQYKEIPATIVVGHGFFFDRMLKELFKCGRKEEKWPSEMKFNSGNCGFWLLQLDILENGEKRMSILSGNNMEHIPFEDRT